MRALFLLLLATSAASAQGTGTIVGTVLDVDGVTAIIGANVRVGGTTLGAATDLDGRYRIIGVPVGTYDVTAYYAGYPSATVTVAEIVAGSTCQLNFTLAEQLDDYGEFGGWDDWRPLITNDAIGQSRIVYGYEIENLPVSR